MKMFKPSEPIGSLDELMKQKFIILDYGTMQKLIPFGFFQNWSLHYCKTKIDAKALLRVEKM